jgi:hypothetical protein
MLRRMRHLTLLTLALCIVLAAEGLFTLGFRTILAARRNKHSELSGTWVLQFAHQEQGRDAPDPKLVRWSWTLNDDGTFTEHKETHAMVIMTENARGNCMRSGDVLTLTGISEGYMDDGYVKGPFKEPFTMKLKYADHALIFLDDAADNDVLRTVFRREGGHAPPKPELQPSDPKAVEIVHEVQRRYAALKSYSDEGTLTSAGRGWMPKNARFHTRFVRPDKFYFQLGGIVVWSDGKKSGLYEGKAAGYQGLRVVGALSMISPTSGVETMLVPALLLPADFHGSMIDPSSREISLVGEDEVSGKDCYMIGVSNPEGMHLKLWIEKSSHLILKAFDSLPKATITYQPQCNIKIAESEFQFTPPK